MNGITPYLNFKDNCREAMTFYKRCLDAELDIRPFSDGGCGALQPGSENLVMHAMLSKNGLSIMASDAMPGSPVITGNNFYICLNCETMEEIQRLFGAFSENGTIIMPLQDTFWGAHFGMLTDQFGVQWMFNHELRK